MFKFYEKVTLIIVYQIFVIVRNLLCFLIELNLVERFTIKVILIISKY